MSDYARPVPPARAPSGRRAADRLPVRRRRHRRPLRRRPRGARRWAVVLRFLLVVGLALSVGLNLVLLVSWLGFGAGLGGGSGRAARAATTPGKPPPRDKIAVVRIEGVIMEGLIGYAHKQIEQAAADGDVKAVVLRINSPGGSITASDDLHRRIIELRDGTRRRQERRQEAAGRVDGRLAASGGYYIAMPGQVRLRRADHHHRLHRRLRRLPNVAELADKYGVKMNVIKAGDIKDSGSMFHDMTPPGTAALAGHGRPRLRPVPGRGRGGPAEAQGQAHQGDYSKGSTRDR